MVLFHLFYVFVYCFETKQSLIDYEMSVLANHKNRHLQLQTTMQTVGIYLKIQQLIENNF